MGNINNNEGLVDVRGGVDPIHLRFTLDTSVSPSWSSNNEAWFNNPVVGSITADIGGYTISSKNSNSGGEIVNNYSQSEHYARIRNVYSSGTNEYLHIFIENTGVIPFNNMNDLYTAMLTPGNDFRFFIYGYFLNNEILNNIAIGGYITDYSLKSSNSNTPTVPVPAGVWLFGSGLLGLLGLKKKKPSPMLATA